MEWQKSCRYNITVSGVKSVDGDVAPAVSSYFYSQFVPLWGNPDVIALDLYGLIDSFPDEMLIQYMYQASLDAWRGIQNGGLWIIPAVDMTLDEMAHGGTDQHFVACLETYVRYRTEYLLLTTAFPTMGVGGTSQKILGDFTINRKGSIGDLKAALDSLIVPEMNAAFWCLAGKQKTKPAPRIVQRASTSTARQKSLDARKHMPAGFGYGRNWDNW